MINLELYKIFVVVANEQNITRASEKLNLTLYNKAYKEFRKYVTNQTINKK